METAANDVFVFSAYPKQFPKKYIKKRMIGENIERYFLRDNPDFLLYYEGIENFNDLPVSIQNHLNENRKALNGRATVKNEGREWWRYSRPMHKEYYNLDYILYFEDIENFKDLPVSIQNYLNENKKLLKGRANKKRRPTAPWRNYTFALHKEYYHLPKIWCSYRSKDNAFIIDETDNYIGLTNTTVIFGTNDDYSLKYLLALLNSKLFAYRFKSMAKQTGSGVFEYLPNNIGKFPIPKAGKNTQDTISELVDKILELKKKESAEPNQQLKTMISRQIDSVDKAIDTAVYQLYNLTDDEIKAVEG
jgi:hypothetical protein